MDTDRLLDWTPGTRKLVFAAFVIVVILGMYFAAHSSNHTKPATKPSTVTTQPTQTGSTTPPPVNPIAGATVNLNPPIDDGTLETTARTASQFLELALSYSPNSDPTKQAEHIKGFLSGDSILVPQQFVPDHNAAALLNQNHTTITVRVEGISVNAETTRSVGYTIVTTVTTTNGNKNATPEVSAQTYDVTLDQTGSLPWLVKNVTLEGSNSNYSGNSGS